MRMRRKSLSPDLASNRDEHVGEGGLVLLGVPGRGAAGAFHVLGGCAVVEVPEDHEGVGEESQGRVCSMARIPRSPLGFGPGRRLSRGNA